MLDNIKRVILDNKGKRVEIIYNGSRNRIESYSGIIVEIYSSLFIIRLDTGLNKSFSYADLLTGVVNIKY